ncbi:type VI secretion system membrane subunit TssM [Methylomicrobium sp. Wu6]|uniref:type VI secretion system membrane subunit TssM n=1 Tax=Methylomicrobium sp. Wu6 TaxID=3107928 RepID=UPI002DD67D52|nr:type VI secretion system membrane subunit TssM [Methylomicrobium sp. Wu6]MEC4750115.1 type VI secretion system membrane subunit TssM [Methylomicrobium sp. Wu6]
MGKLKAIFTNKWVIQFLGLAALSCLIWLAGPLIAIAGSVPLESVLARTLVIVGLFVTWVIFRLAMQLRAGSAEKQLVEQLVSADADPIATASADEVDTLRKGFEEAFAVLKKSRADGKSRGQFVYQLPWYAIIGAPGSGKTTALVNSGLHFPLAEKLGKPAIKGVSGTRNCDWWFADNAVFLDTAGRYTMQESHKAVDAAGWAGFLALIKKYRPRRPLNGVIVATSLSDLLQQSEQERLLHAKAVRSRIHELYQHLGVRLPVYMMFTKADLVAGFNDFFADLTQEQRAQVWGETFSADTLSGDPDVSARFATAYDELLQRLQHRTLGRIQDERDVRRRASILDFPQQMALAKPAMLDFLQATYAANRYEEPVLLRGVYFTSGTQEGTPIDRMLGILAGAFHLDRQVVPMYSGQGKSYFLTRLLQDVLFPEAELAGQDPKLEKRTRWLQLGAYIGAGLVFLSVISLWTISYFNNRSALEKVEEQIAQYRSIKLSASNTQDNFQMLLPRLNILQAIVDVYRDGGPMMGFGLSQGDKIQAAAHHAYDAMLREYFLPSIMLRLKERMQSAEGNKLDVLYELLKVYLMFNQTDRMAPETAMTWIRADWDRQYASDPETVAQLVRHLDNLLKLQLDPARIDDDFVNSVRGKLMQVPLIGQIYSRFKSEATLDQAHDFRLGKELGADGARVFALSDGKDFSSYSIPAVFTGYGYKELFLTKSRDFVKDAVEQNWVLGSQTRLEVAEVEKLHAELKKLYIDEYKTVWSDLLAKLKLQPALTTSQMAQMLDILSRPDGPLRKLLDGIDANTSFSRLGKEASDSIAKAVGNALKSPDAKTSQLLAMAKNAAGVDSGPDPAIAAEVQFEPLNNLVRGGPDKPIALEPVLQQLKSLRDYFLQLSSANTGGQALQNQASLFSGGGTDVLKQAQLEFARLPAPLNGWLQIIVSSGGQKLSSAAKGQLSEMVKTGVASPCKAALTGRYPFNTGANQDVLLADFAKIFAPSGLMDQFFQANLKPFVDTSKPVWTEMTAEKPLGLSQESIRRFQLAAKIRDAFFAAGASPQVQFELKPQALDPNVGTFRLQIEGQEAVYRHGPEQAASLKWPGPTPSQGVRIVFETLDGHQTSRSKEGTWAFFRLLDEATIEPTAAPEKFNLTFQLEGMSARYELRAASVMNPFNLREMQGFRCPEGL